MNKFVWKWAFTERERKEIEFSQLYAQSFGHGTDGHNAKQIIAKMATLLDDANFDDVPHDYLDKFRKE